MSAAGRFLRRWTHGYVFWCPGCKHPHVVRTEKSPEIPNAPCWTFSGTAELPTISPSVLVFITDDEDDQGQPLKEPRRVTLCHLFLNAGQLQFLSDCQHELAGQTVPLPPFPETVAVIGEVRSSREPGPGS